MYKNTMIYYTDYHYNRYWKLTIFRLVEVFCLPMIHLALIMTCPFMMLYLARRLNLVCVWGGGGGGTCGCVSGRKK